jgi:hypothetical protein
MKMQIPKDWFQAPDWRGKGREILKMDKGAAICEVVCGIFGFTSGMAD